MRQTGLPAAAAEEFDLLTEILVQRIESKSCS